MGFLDGIGSTLGNVVSDVEQGVESIAKLDPIGAGINAIGNALGLDPKLTAALEMGAGFMTGDVTSMVRGAEDLVNGRAANPGDSAGYAPDSMPTAGDADHATAKDMDAQTAMYVLSQQFDAVDTASGQGGKDGNVSRDDLQAVVEDPNASPELKATCQYLLDNASAFNQADVGGGGGVDGIISKAGVQSVLASEMPQDLSQIGQRMGDLAANAKKCGEEYVDSANAQAAAKPGSKVPVHPDGETADGKVNSPAHAPTPPSPPAASDDSSAAPTDDSKPADDTQASGDASTGSAPSTTKPAGSLDEQMGNYQDQLDALEQKVESGNLSQADLAKCQAEMQRLSEMVQLISNIEKAEHDMRMAVINNIR